MNNAISKVSAVSATAGATALRPLFERQLLWRGRQSPAADSTGPRVGYAALAALIGPCWPQGEVIECASTQPAIGEFQLLCPALAELSTQQSVALVCPPALPYAPRLRAEGIAAAHLWLIGTAAGAALRPAQALWATEQLLRDSTIAAVVAWLPQAGDAQLRRLKLYLGRKLLFVWRPPSALQQPSIAALRLTIELGPERLPRVRVHKCRGRVGQGLVELPELLEPRNRRERLAARHAQRR